MKDKEVVKREVLAAVGNFDIVMVEKYLYLEIPLPTNQNHIKQEKDSENRGVVVIDLFNVGEQEEIYKTIKSKESFSFDQE